MQFDIFIDQTYIIKNNFKNKFEKIEKDKEFAQGLEKWFIQLKKECNTCNSWTELTKLFNNKSNNDRVFYSGCENSITEKYEEIKKTLFEKFKSYFNIENKFGLDLATDVYLFKSPWKCKDNNKNIRLLYCLIYTYKDKLGGDDFLESEGDNKIKFFIYPLKYENFHE